MKPDQLMDQFMSKWESLSELEIIGAACTLIGSFLPWGYVDGFVIKGTKFHLTHDGWSLGSVYRYDNGGVIIIILTVVLSSKEKGTTFASGFTLQSYWVASDSLLDIVSR